MCHFKKLNVYMSFNNYNKSRYKRWKISLFCMLKKKDSVKHVIYIPDFYPEHPEISTTNP